MAVVVAERSGSGCRCTCSAFREVRTVDNGRLSLASLQTRGGSGLRVFASLPPRIGGGGGALVRWARRERECR